MRLSRYFKSDGFRHEKKKLMILIGSMVVIMCLVTDAGKASFTLD